MKPFNVMITPEGTVKLLDFGIARRMAPLADSKGAPSNADDATASAPLMTGSEWRTQHAGILGTPPYMSPEQLLGGSLTERADLWAFGVMLYEALTGKPLFLRQTPEETRRAILTVEPDWNALPGGAPASLRALIRLCLEKSPSARLRSAEEAKRLLAPDAPVLPWPLIRNFIHQQAPALTLFLGLTILAILVWAIRPAIRPALAKQVSLAVSHRDAESCDPRQSSGSVAGILMNRLKDTPRLTVYAPERTPERISSRADLPLLARAFGAQWMLQIATNCADAHFSIAYDLIDRSTDEITHGEARDIEQLQTAVLGKLGLPSTQSPISDDERVYYGAAALLTQYFNNSALETATRLLAGLHEKQPTAPHVSAALAKAYRLQDNLMRDQKGKLPSSDIPSPLRRAPAYARASEQ